MATAGLIVATGHDLGNHYDQKPICEAKQKFCVLELDSDRHLGTVSALTSYRGHQNDNSVEKQVLNGSGFWILNRRLARMTEQPSRRCLVLLMTKMSPRALTRH